MHSVTEKTVRVYHTDCYGHVYHGRYVELLEEGRWAYLEDNPRLAKTLFERRIHHAVVHMEMTFQKPAKLGDRLRIESGVDSANDRSVTMGQHIRRHRTGETILSARITQIYYRHSPENCLSLSDKAFSGWPDLQQIIGQKGDDHER